MNSIRRQAVLASVISLFGILAWTSPAWAIHPMGLRLMPAFRITPAMNGMGAGMGMNPMFNVQTGVVAVPRFHNGMSWHNNWMGNRFGNSLNSAPGNYNMMGGYGSYPSMSGYGGGGGGGSGSNQLSSVPQPAATYESNSTNGPMGPHAAEASRILSAAGLPNSEGLLTWPVGLQVLFPIVENLDLINELEASFQTAAVQKTSGAVDEDLLKGVSKNIAKFRSKLRGREPYMAIPTYQEADRFLAHMDDAVNRLRGNKLTSGKQ
jgi:hypothetical protein